MIILLCCLVFQLWSAAGRKKWLLFFTLIHEVHLRANSALLPTKSALLQ